MAHTDIKKQRTKRTRQRYNLHKILKEHKGITFFVKERKFEGDFSTYTLEQQIAKRKLVDSFGYVVQLKAF